MARKSEVLKTVGDLVKLLQKFDEGMPLAIDAYSEDGYDHGITSVYLNGKNNEVVIVVDTTETAEER